MKEELRKERINDQDDLRQQFIMYLKAHPQSTLVLCKKLGLSYNTIKQFLRGETSLYWMSVHKIVDYLKNN